MASDLISGPKSVAASADLSASIFLFMKLDTNGQLAVVSSSGAQLIAGVLQDKPTAQGQPGMLCRPGDITKVVLAGTVAKGGSVMSNASGKAVAATSGSWIHGLALDAGVSGDIIRIIFQQLGKL